MYDGSEHITTALTIRQPWAWAICSANRRMDNRDWRPPPYVANQTILIHAAKSWGRSERIDASALACQLHPQFTVPLGSEGYVLGHLVAAVRVVGFVDLDIRSGRGPYSFDTQTSKGYACVGGQFSPADVEAIVSSPWFKGPCAWLFANVRVLDTPVEVRGYQKLWRVPGPVALDVARQVNLA